MTRKLLLITALAGILMFDLGWRQASLRIRVRTCADCGSRLVIRVPLPIPDWASRFDWGQLSL